MRLGWSKGGRGEDDEGEGRADDEGWGGREGELVLRAGSEGFSNNCACVLLIRINFLNKYICC